MKTMAFWDGKQLKLMERDWPFQATKNHHSFRIQKVMFTLQNEIHIACQLG